MVGVTVSTYLFEVRMPFPVDIESDNVTSFATFSYYRSARDPIWKSLMLWRDLNHNGISEANELAPLQGSGVTAIDLGYHWAGRTDAWGNAFRYESLVSIGDTPGSGVRKKPIYDIFFVRVRK